MSQEEQDAQLLAAAGAAGSSGTSLQAMPTQGPPRYPPSAVKKWLTCPEFWRLSKVWEPRVEPWTPHRSVGTAIHAGLAVYLRQVGGMEPSSPESLADPVAESQRVLEGLYEAQDTWGLDGLQALVVKGVLKLQGLLESDILPGATIVAVEYPDPIQDERVGLKRTYRIVDAILARADHLEVWDWKTKIKLDNTYLPETQRAVLHSWQLLDYSWHARQWARAGRLPTLPDRAPSGAPWTVSHAAHGLVVLGPKLMAQAIPVTLALERLTQWHQDAERIWTLMWFQEREDWRAPATWHNWEACTDRHLHYGKECVYMTACHQLNGDEKVFDGAYKMIDNRQDDTRSKAMEA